MQILDLAVLGEHILDVLLGRFLVHVGDDDDPAFYAANRNRLFSCVDVRVAVFARALRRGRRVFHLSVGHGVVWQVRESIWYAEGGCEVGLLRPNFRIVVDLEFASFGHKS